MDRRPRAARTVRAQSRRSAVPIVSGVPQEPLGLLVVGTSLLVAVGLLVGARRLGWPPFAGFLLVGLALGTLNLGLPVLSPNVRHVLEFLADAGLVALLFRVGLQSDLRGLFEELPRSSLIWLSNVVPLLLAQLSRTWMSTDPT